MNAPRVAFRITPDVIARILILLWLLGLSVAVVSGHRAINRLAGQAQTSVASQQVLVLEARVAELVASLQALEARPPAATTEAVQEVQQTLHARIAQIEQGLASFATTDEVQAVRDEIEQIKVRQAAVVRAAPTPAPRRAPKPAVLAPKPEPFPYRVIGAELRAGLRSVSVISSTGDFSAEQIQVLLPGDAIGAWRLQTINGNTAAFQSGEQVRRIAIPGSE